MADIWARLVAQRERLLAKVSAPGFDPLDRRDADVVYLLTLTEKAIIELAHETGASPAAARLDARLTAIEDTLTRVEASVEAAGYLVG